MTARTAHPAPQWQPSRLYSWTAIAAGVFWTWAVALLSTRQHLVGTYTLIPTAPWFWGPVLLPLPMLFLVLGLGVLLTLLAVRYARTGCDRFPPALAWLLGAGLVPALDLFRMLGWLPVPATFVEPLALAGLTALAVGEMADRVRMPAGVQ
ncbi:MAG: hypothetical protein ACYC6Y_25415, partial [Thermoguttaceae bacterium]